MLLKRGKLKEIYTVLPNSEKTAWAKNAGYSGYQGLVKYISQKGDEVAYSRIVDALRETVGEERFKDLTIREHNEKIQSLLDRIYEQSSDSYRYDIFVNIAERQGFDTDTFLNLETEMTDLLRKFEDSDELIEKIRVVVTDIMNMVIVRNFSIPMVQKEVEDSEN